MLQFYVQTLHHSQQIYLFMKLRKTQQQIYSAVDHILNKGASKLYDQYITAKIPPHTSQQVHPITENIFRSAYFQAKQKNIKIKQKQPHKCSVDSFAPNRIKIKRKSISQIGFMPKKVPLSTFKSEKNTQPNVIKKNQNIKPGFSIKYLCQAPNENVLKQEKLRKQIKERRQNERQRQKNERIIQAKKKAKQRQRDAQVKELKVKGVHFLYNDEGMLINPRLQKMKLKQQCPQNEVVELGYNTLQFGEISNISVSEKKNVLGRKKGFYSLQKFSKKQKLTNQDFNNNEERQFSSIPFLNLCEGIKVVEKNKDITASKGRQPQSTRQEFVKQNQSTCFKSFMPDISDQVSEITLRTISVFERPNTTANFTRTKITTNTGFEQSRGRKSLLWRPKTTTKSSSRMTVNNENLVKDLICQEQ